MRITAFQSFLLFNIMFLTGMHAQNLIPDPGMASQPSPNLRMASGPSPECPAGGPQCSAPSLAGPPSNPGMATLAPSGAPSNSGMAPLEPSGAPSLPGMTPLRPSAPSLPGMTPLTPSAAPSNPGMTPLQPSAAPSLPGMSPLAPSAEPSNPGMAPLEPSATPSLPVMAPLAPSAAPSNPGMAPLEPNAAPSLPGMAPLAPSAAPSIPGVASAPSSAFNLSIGLPPSLAPLTLNCKSCPIDPFGLAACGMVMVGDTNPDKVGLCCSTLSSLSNEDASACLCNAIEIKAVKIGDFNVTQAMNNALAVCRPEASSPGMAPAPSSTLFDAGIILPPSSAFAVEIGLPPILGRLNLNCSRCPVDPFGLAECGMLITGNIKIDTVAICCRALTSLSREDASACLCNAIDIKALKIGEFDVTAAIDKALDVCRPEPANIMALGPSSEYLDLAVSLPPSEALELGISVPPSLAPPKLNCSKCPIDPFGLAACGMVIGGKMRPETIGLCCSALDSLSKEDASACVCNAIEMKAVKFGDFDVADAMKKVLGACSKL